MLTIIVTPCIVYRVACGVSPCAGDNTSARLGDHLPLEVPQQDDHASHADLTQDIPDAVAGTDDGGCERIHNQPAAAWPAE